MGLRGDIMNETINMKMSIGNDNIKIYKENCYYLIKEVIENGKLRADIYVKYNDDKITYFIESVADIYEAMDKVKIGYLDPAIWR
jgi:polyhydroxyalkanoate synthesis regulator phasin